MAGLFSHLHLLFYAPARFFGRKINEGHWTRQSTGILVGIMIILILGFKVTRYAGLVPWIGIPGLVAPSLGSILAYAGGSIVGVLLTYFLRTFLLVLVVKRLGYTIDRTQTGMVVAYSLVFGVILAATSLFMDQPAQFEVMKFLVSAWSGWVLWAGLTTIAEIRQVQAAALVLALLWCEYVISSTFTGVAI